MADTLDPKVLDKRTVARYIRAGLVDEKAYERHLKSLPDLAEQAATVEADLAPNDNDEGEEHEDSAPGQGG
jgi:hypothetical protein